MKVRDLIEELSKQNPNHEVFIVNQNLKQIFEPVHFKDLGIHDNIVTLPLNTEDNYETLD